MEYNKNQAEMTSFFSVSQACAACVDSAQMFCSDNLLCRFMALEHW